MTKVNPALVPQRRLSNGMVIPGIGMGTFGNDRFTSSQVLQFSKYLMVVYLAFMCSASMRFVCC